jgi:predicted RNA-binding Zn-ribbon protein involved in translation (DUF1610 family)
MFNNPNEIKFGFQALGAGIVAGFAASPSLAFIIFVGIAIYYSISGFYTLLVSDDHPSANTRGIQKTNIQPTSSAPITDESTIAERIKAIHIKNDFKCPSCGATVLPTDVKCKHCGSILVAMVDLPRPEKWGDIEIGRAVEVKHPQKGSMSLSVTYRIYYGELWQAQMKPDVPWTLTGSYYVGLGLNENIFLMNWQNRFYILDLHQPLTDMSINRDFAPYARKFAASNQTQSVSFSYQDTIWNMLDIGRFRIEYAEGDGIRVSPGAVGRFIHATHNNKALVVEDYQTGGSGLDTLWMGYQLEEEDIKL